MNLPSDYIVVDIETTGCSKNDDIIEIAAVKVRNNVIVDKFESLIKPSVQISSDITELTGITNKLVANAPPFEDVLNDFLAFIDKDVLIGHNIDNFDMRFISAKALESCGVVIHNTTIDTLKISRNILPIKHHKLADLCNYFSVSNNNAHRAMSDVMATHECYQHLKNGDAGMITENKDEETNYKCNHKPHYSDETKALQTLQGMLLGVTCDNVLVESEVIFIKKWLEENKHLSGNYPFDVAYSEIEKALEDGVLEPHELQSLLSTFIKLINPVFGDTESEGKMSRDMNLYGITVCLSGEFKHGTKEQVSELLIALGANIKDTVTKKVGMLIVGDNGSSEWRFGNYGGKVKKAMEMRDKGIDIEIISETDFYKKLDKINAQNDQINFETDNNYLSPFLAEMIETECQKQNVASSFIQIVKNANDSQSVWICDPEWMLDFEGKLTQNAFSVGKTNKGYEVILSIGRNELNDFVPVPAEATVKNTVMNYKNKTSIIFTEFNDSLKKYISDVFAWELNHFTPSYQFSCCGKYKECSDAGKCLHKNLMYARGCYYRKNLETDRVFYGKNATNDIESSSLEKENIINP